MAFTGTPTILQISDNVVRITGLSLASGASGTIGFFEHTGGAPDVTLPQTFKTEHYVYDDTNIPFSDAIQVTVNPVTTTSNFQQVGITKSGTTRGDWRATLNNAFASVSATLEIYVRFH